MPSIAIIGAGSVVFTRALCNDILLSPALRDSHIRLMDIDPRRLDQALALVQAMIEQRGLPARVEATLDRRQAVQGADAVITTFQQGGLDAYQLDIDIPARYGLGQCVGDTLGPGGVFRGLRTIPVLLDLCRDLDDVAPNALLLNYVNPMAINCWAVDAATGRPCVGLCHSVQGTSEMLAEWLGVPYNELRYDCAGINHQAFFLELRHGDEDLYPRLREVVRQPEVRALEPVRIDLLEHFGLFVTESSGHASEYVPYYRKNAAMIADDLVPRFGEGEHSSWFDYGNSGGYLRHCLGRLAYAEQDFAALASGAKPLPETRSHEYGSYIVEARVTGEPVTIYGNVPNRGLIDNLPASCCVEVACQVDGAGVHPRRLGQLPPQVAALNTTNVNVQELAVRAALMGDRDAAHHAVMLDPLTAAVCTLGQIHDMVDEMLDAQAAWLPQFR